MSLVELSRLLPLPDEELRQVLDYASTLSKADAVAHLQNLLGDSPQTVNFVSSFNARRVDPTTTANDGPLDGPLDGFLAAPTPPTASSSAQSSDVDPTVAPDRQLRPRKKKKSKPLLHTPAPRQVASFALAPGASYNKKSQQDDYIAARPSSSNSLHKTPTSVGSGPANAGPVNTLLPPKSATPTPPTAPAPTHRPSSYRPAPSAGRLVSELGLPKPKAKPTSSRASTPLAKVALTGGVPMHGASTALTDLDQAIRSLEQTTNPTHQSNSPAGAAARRCNCVAVRHPLQSAAPNCLRCGKVICVKEGLGPCTYCGAPLLDAADVQAMVRELVAERGRERMAADRQAHHRPGTKSSSSVLGDSFPPIEAGSANASARITAEAMALRHRDRLLSFQAQNAQRTTVRDEAADFDVSSVGNIWASPEERAQELKKQQQLLREMDWNAQPEYEKRRQVVSIDLVAGTVIKKMAVLERPASSRQDPGNARGGTPPETHVQKKTDAGTHSGDGVGTGTGAFSRNPLLGGVIKPIYKGKDAAALQGCRDKRSGWRRVQDDLDDNQAVILDGGMYEGSGAVNTATNDEPECG